MRSTRTDADPVTLLDVNLLLAATVASHVHHRPVVRWFDTVVDSGWATTALTESALVRLLLNRAVMGEQLGADEALSALRAIRALPGWHFLTDDSSLADPVIETTALVGHRQVPDFHLINLAVAHDHVFATLDRALPTYLPEHRDAVVIVPVDA